MPAATKSMTTLLLVAALALAGCSRKSAPVTAPPPPPVTTQTGPAGSTPPAGQQVRVEAAGITETPLVEEALTDRRLEDLNRDSPFQPVFFALDRADLDETGRAASTANAAILQRFRTWIVTIEGHCDERGTAEYNLALGERRAMAVRTYLVSLGVSSDRLRTVSYGKESPFDRGHTEAAWSKNRRGHFVITAK